VQIGVAQGTLGWDLALERRIAIKEFLPRELAGRAGDQATVTPHSAEDGEVFRYGLGQFLREARTLAQLDHPNIVRVLQVFEANGTAYLVMEYYEGLTLAEHLERHGGRLPEDIAKQLLRPVLDGLRAAHAKGFLHRDIKPQNIYLARTEGGGARPILLDFGAARQAVGERSQSVSVLGTPGHAPFEQYDSRGHQGAWTDIYAAAAVLYRMVTGEPPPPSSDRMAGDDLKPATAFGVSKGLSDTLSSALSINPEKRPQTVHAFQAELWPAAAKPQREPAPPALSTAPSRPAWRAWPWLLVVISAAGAWFWHDQQQGQMERRHQDDLAYAVA
jgi:serine/threonine protein kinase